MSSQATPANANDHEWIKFHAGEPERCRYCGLHRAVYDASAEKSACPVGPEWRPTEDPEPDESATCAVYHPSTLQVKFRKSEAEARAWLGSDVGAGSDAQGWCGPISIRSTEVHPGALFDWDLLAHFFVPERIPKRFSHRSMDRNIDRLLAGVDLEPTCFLRSTAAMERRAESYEGHFYDSQAIETPQHQLAAVVRDLQRAFRRAFPNATAPAVADFLSSFNMYRHVHRFAQRMAVDPRMSERFDPRIIAAAGDFIMELLYAQSHEIRVSIEPERARSVRVPDTRRKPIRRATNMRIDKELRRAAEMHPSNHEQVFHALEGRAPIPPAKPFNLARGWLAGFHRDPPAARAWLSKAWSHLGLPPFPHGPK